MRPYRTVLEQKIRERRMTLEEFTAYAENFAREHGEPGTLSLRHLQRLVAGKGPKGQPLGPIRPATARLLERIFEIDSSELLASPAQRLAPPDDGDAADLRARIQKSRRVDAGMLQGLRDQLNTIRRIDRQYGAIVTHNELLAKISQTRDLFTYSLTDDTRRELAILLSEMHALAGWQSLDMGHCSASWHHYEHAKTAALETGDVSFSAHAAAEQSFTLIDLDEFPAALSQIEFANHLAQRSSTNLLKSWLCAAHGEALAAVGRATESFRKFDEAERWIQHDDIKGERPYLALDSSHLRRWRGHSASRLGDEEAVPLLRESLNRLDSSFSRAESALRIDLATSLAAQGQSESADKQLRCARELAVRIGSARQVTRIRNIRAR